MTENPDVPFDMSYVISTTVEHMKRSVDISIRKTFDRIKDFPENSDKSKEIFQTLSHLHQMRKSLDEYKNSICGANNVRN